MEDLYRSLLDDNPAGVRQKRWEDRITENLQWEEAIKSEDESRGNFILKNAQPGMRAALTLQPTKRRPKRAELLGFVRSQTQAPSGGWKATLQDPEAAAAMRALQRRVTKLRDFDAPQPRANVSTAPTMAGEWSYRMLNGHQGRCGQPKPPGQLKQLGTSLEHPLAYNEHCKGWNPHARKWPGRTLPFMPKAPTSLWCEGWGRSANPDPIDFNFRYDLPVRSAKSYYQLENLARDNIDAIEATIKPM